MDIAFWSIGWIKDKNGYANQVIVAFSILKKYGGNMSLFGIAADALQGKLQDKLKSVISEYYQEWLDKKKIEELWDDLCAGQEGQRLFDNQGFAEGIDFYVLTNTLRTELIDNVLFYYNEAD